MGDDSIDMVILHIGMGYLVTLPHTGFPFLDVCPSYTSVPEHTDRILLPGLATRPLVRST